MYYIIELANTHGGSLEYLNDLIKKFENIGPRAGMKFQAFAPDTISTPDFEWYPVYQQLNFTPKQWTEIIELAGKTKDIWLDIFDEYGIEIFNSNSDKIYGIKFQSSVLHNREVMNALSKSDLSDKYLIVNIAAQPLDAIAEIIGKVEKELAPKEIWLEIGFQAYPTELPDSGLNKIELLKNKFGKRIVFADHADGKSEDAVTLPLIASTMGVDAIEKHVLLDDRETKYDHFSSITFERFQHLISRVDNYRETLNAPFINEREETYLLKSIMNPILKFPKRRGSGLSLDSDFMFRRTALPGLNSRQISEKIKGRQILRTDKQAGETLKNEDFKSATVAAIIACRLKSSRLPGKALEKIGDLTSVEYCIANTMKLEGVNHVILATSTTDQDAELENYTFDPSVIFHRGHPEDVIDRYLEICRKLKIDVIIRITADMPYVDDEVAQLMLEEHFKSGADYTTGVKAPAGANLEIISVAALERVKEHFPSADYSEYMTWYFQNNPDHFKLHFVELPEHLIRDYRLTLDYPEDLEMFNKVSEHFKAAGKTDFSLNELIRFLDENQDIAEINKHCVLTYRTDESLIALLNEKTRIR